MVIAAIIFLCVSVGALIGMSLRGRLPDHHFNDDSKDVVKLVMGLIGTMAALVLGLLIASAKTSYEVQSGYVVQLAADVVELDRLLDRYGPETKDARAQFRLAVKQAMKRIWPKDPASSPQLEPAKIEGPAEAYFEAIGRLSPKTSAQQFAQSQAMQLSAGLLHTRALMYEQATGSISLPFLVVLVSWLVLLFLGFGILTRPNGTVVTALLVGALSVAGAIYLILDLYTPYTGLMRISSAPIVSAMAQIGP
jgi:hypothetical protein